MGQHVIIVNYVRDEFETGVPQNFDARLYTINGGIPVEFSKAHIKIQQGKKTVLDTNTPRSKNGDTDFTYEFKKDGYHTLTIQYFLDKTLVSQATFPFLVEASKRESSQALSPATIALIGVSLIALGYLSGFMRVHTKILKSFKRSIR